MVTKEVPDGEYTIPLGLLISNVKVPMLQLYLLEKSSKKRTLLLTNWLKKAFHVKLSI
jgi:hypothetical protein